eukprot:CAMPEP_0194398710 /NCGR_PEP_ID=MMETSP0174-20130528/126258_1 /TAXON_ID=216777 /ORGANISM="Proboscia alata, Strain PI-D3" /LENGTH=640 /DNA_ID=CAMNT_0039195043 /DNA_START=95 /DNA_END=2013 /DNA_ORIENTATION=-
MPIDSKLLLDEKGRSEIHRCQSLRYHENTSTVGDAVKAQYERHELQKKLNQARKRRGQLKLALQNVIQKEKQPQSQSAIQIERVALTFDAESVGDYKQELSSLLKYVSKAEIDLKDLTHMCNDRMTYLGNCVLTNDLASMNANSNEAKSKLFAFDDVPKNFLKKDMAILDPLWCLGGYEPLRTVLQPAISSDSADIMTNIGCDLKQGLRLYTDSFLRNAMRGGGEFEEAENFIATSVVLHSTIYPSESIRMDAKQLHNIMGRKPLSLGPLVDESSKERNVDDTRKVSTPLFVGLHMMHQNNGFQDKSLPFGYIASSIVSQSQSSNHIIDKKRNRNPRIPNFAHVMERVEILLLSTSDVDESQMLYAHLTNTILKLFQSLLCTEMDFSNATNQNNVRTRIREISPSELLPCEASCIVVEGFLPTTKMTKSSSNQYIELGRVSYFTDYISRALNTKHDLKTKGGIVNLSDGSKFIHTIHASLCCFENIIGWMLENNASSVTINQVYDISQHNADSGKSCPKPHIEHRTLNNLKDVASWDGVLIPSLLAIHLRETDGLPVTDDSAKKVQGLSNNMHHFLPFCRKRSRNKHGKMVINTIKMSQILKHKQVGGTVCTNRVSNASPVGDGISKARINDGNKLDQST